MRAKTSTDVNVYAYFRHPEDARLPHVIQAFAEDMMARGFLVIRSSEQQILDEWARQFSAGQRLGRVASEMRSPHISALARDEIQRFISGKADNLSLSMLSLATTSPMAGFRFTLELNAADGTLQALADEGDFRLNGQADHDRYDQWVTLLRTIYSQWHPIFAFAVDEAHDFMTTREQALQFGPACLYDINFYGPEIVDRLGRERFQNLNAWKITDLDDGGILLIPTPYYTVNSPYDRRAIAERLGLPDQVFPVDKRLLNELSKKVQRLRSKND